MGSKSAISLQRRPVDSKFHVEGVAPTNHSFFRKLGKMIFRMYNNLNGFFFRFVTIHTFDRLDRQTDGQNSHR